MARKGKAIKASKPVLSKPFHEHTWHNTVGLPYAGGVVVEKCSKCGVIRCNKDWNGQLLDLRPRINGKPYEQLAPGVTLHRLEGVDIETTPLNEMVTYQAGSLASISPISKEAKDD